MAYSEHFWDAAIYCSVKVIDKEKLTFYRYVFDQLPCASQSILHLILLETFLKSGRTDKYCKWELKTVQIIQNTNLLFNLATFVIEIDQIPKL